MPRTLASLALAVLCALAPAGPALGAEAPLRPDPKDMPPNAVDKRPAPPAPEVLVLFCEAVQLKLQEKYADAIEKLQQALARDEDSPAVLFELGYCYYRLGKHKEAAEQLKRSLALDPQNGPAHETLAFVYNGLGERDKALEELEAAAKAADRPRNHEGLVQQIARIYERQGDYKNAIHWYQYLLECGYRDRRAYLLLGALQLKEKRYDDALTSFREVVRRTSTDEVAADDVASAYGQLSEAERGDALRRHEAATANSNDPATLEALAIAYRAAGRSDDMLRALERAAALVSERADGQTEFLADEFEQLGDLPKAIEWRLKVIARRSTPSAEDLIRLAGLHVRHEELDKAADTYGKALAADPKRADLRRRIALCYSELYQWDKAIAALEEALKGQELGPGDAETVFELGRAHERAGHADLAAEHKKRAYDLLAGAIGKTGSRPAEVHLHIALAELYYADEKPDKALAYITVAQQLDPNDGRKLLLLAMAYKRVQNWAEAAATYRRCAEKEPRSPVAAGALFEVATCLESAGQGEPAAEARRQAKQLLLELAEASPNEGAKALAQMQLGEIELQRNQPAIAAAHFLEALRLDPRQSIAHVNLGQCYQMLGDWARAAAHYKSFIDGLRAVEERHARILYRLGVARCRCGQADLGKEDKRRAIELLRGALDALEREKRGTPAHKAEIHRDLAGLYASGKDYPKALEAMQRAIQLAPAGKRADYQLALAALYDDLKRYDDSEKVLLDAHAAEPGNAAVLNHLGYFYAERGRELDKAVALVQKALASEPLNGAYLDSLGWAYYKQGKHEEALRLLLRATEYEEDAVIRDHLGDAYHKLGKLHEARQAWTKALALDPDIEGVAEKLKSTQPKDPPQPPKAPEKGERP